MLPGCEGSTFTAFLQPECPIELHGGSGRRASVDYAINIEGNNHVINCIPIEAKSVLDALHMKQLASYINKVSTADVFSDTSIVGILLSPRTFQFSFSPYKFDGKALPIVYTTPHFEWRSEKCVSSKGLLLLSVVHLIKLARLTFQPTEGNVADDLVLEVAMKLYESPFDPQPLSSKVVPDTAYERLAFIQAQQEKIRQQQEQLKANDERLCKQTLELKQKSLELEAADRRMKEELEAADRRMKEELQARTSELQQELEAADRNIKEELQTHAQKIEQIEQLVELTSSPPKRRKREESEEEDR
jgi:hypothetical protein